MSNSLFPYGRRCHLDPVPGADALATDQVCIDYPGSNRTAVRDVSVRVAPGTRVALVGPNGAGKSTLLKAAAGLLPVHSGTIKIYGNAVGGCHHRVAYLPQRGEIDWKFPISVERLVLTGRYVHLGWLRRPSNGDRQIARDTISRLGLDALAQRQIGALSGGQQQRVLLARALAQGADLLLLDEPLNAVDATTREIVRQVLEDLKKQGKAMLVATHDIGRLESDFDGIVYLNEGRQVTPPKDPSNGQHATGHCNS
jgi:manganese/zinc/iron transport system ATP- binding protein